MLLGEEAPDKGTVELGANVKVGYLPQVITFDNEEYTVIQAFSAFLHFYLYFLFLLDSF